MRTASSGTSCINCFRTCSVRDVKEASESSGAESGAVVSLKSTSPARTGPGKPANPEPSTVACWPRYASRRAWGHSPQPPKTRHRIPRMMGRSLMIGLRSSCSSRMVFRRGFNGFSHPKQIKASPLLYSGAGKDASVAERKVAFHSRHRVGYTPCISRRVPSRGSCFSFPSSSFQAANTSP